MYQIQCFTCILYSFRRFTHNKYIIYISFVKWHFRNDVWCPLLYLVSYWLCIHECLSTVTRLHQSDFWMHIKIHHKLFVLLNSGWTNEYAYVILTNLIAQSPVTQPKFQALSIQWSYAEANARQHIQFPYSQKVSIPFVRLVWCWWCDCNYFCYMS